jgi:succinate dehydrogenase/fumarate reductase flavoprotein subunit
MYVNRRTFLKGSLGLGVLAFSSYGILSRCSAFDDVTTMVEGAILKETDVLVIGGGITAAFAAIKAKESGANVLMIDKGRVGHSGLTPWFHGFAVYDEEKGSTKDEWTKQFLLATEYISHMDYINLFLQESKNRWNELVEWGATSNGGNGGIGPILRQKVLDAGVTIIERTMMTDLIKKDGKIVGALGFPLEKESPFIVKAGAVILCTGAGTFKTPGWPAAPNTFDGHMMAYRAGAEISGKEWNDFHQTNSVTPDYTYGSNGGSYSVNIQAEYEASAHSLNHLFYSAINGIDTEIDAETYERLSVSRDSGSGPQGDGPGDGGPGGPPSGENSESTDGMDGAPSDSGAPSDGGPPQGESTESESSDSDSQELSPGTVLGATCGQAEHRCDGVFPQDEKCSAGIDGLYAAGDALCTGGVGLAGSATPGCTVQGAVAGTAAAEYALNNTTNWVTDDELQDEVGNMLQPLYLEKGYSGEYVIQLVQNIMVPYYVLYVKEQTRLETALSSIKYLKEHFVPLLIANDMHELRLAHEARNIVLNAEMKLRASLFRTESRHSHYREDLPYRDDENWLAWVMINKSDEGMVLSKKTIPEDWIIDYGLSYEERYTDRFPGELEYLNSKQS